MNCPRCGSPNEPRDRFCSSCGAALVETPAKERRSLRERIGSLIGTDRRSRAITATTVIALAIAVAAFIALDEDEEESIPRDSYTIAADRMCVAAKRQIVAIQRAGFQGDSPDTSTGARSLLPVVSEWRADFDALRVPSDRLEQARALDQALQEVERRIGTLARIATGGDRKEIVVQARQADQASSVVEKRISDLGLSQCARLTIGVTQN